jgi:pimeloyl-ACP methyl ester carboxylesterase
VFIIEQDSFSAPELDYTNDEPLVIHTKPVRDNKIIVVFVHGLGGVRYGENSTWGHFPRFIYEDLVDSDIGLYQYTTAFRRLNIFKSISLNEEADIFAGIIRDLDRRYEKIILIGHSMGGLLSMAALARLIATNQKSVLCRVAGLILMATPQTGSQRTPPWLSLFSHDAWALKPHGEFVAGLHDLLVDHHIVVDETRAESNDIVIPTWAVLGAFDYWVDKLSAGLRLPSARKKTVRGSHSAIVKPATKQTDAYEFVRDRIFELCRKTNESSSNDDLRRAARLRITVGLARLFSLRFLEGEKAGNRFELLSKESLRGEAYLSQFERQFDSYRNILPLRDVLILEEFIDFLKRTTAKWRAKSEIEYDIDSHVFKVWYSFFPMDAEDELRNILWGIGGPLRLYFDDFEY